MLCCCPVTHCLLHVRACCISFEYLQRNYPFQKIKLLFMILYFEGMSYNNISIPEVFRVTFVVFSCLGV